MTLTEALQFYAPIAGLIVLAFFMGMQHQRINALEKATSEIKSGMGKSDGEENSIVARLIRLEVQGEGNVSKLNKIEHDVQNVQRQLGNLMSQGYGPIKEFKVG